MTDEPTLTPMTKLYWLGLLEKDRGVWVLRDGEGDEAEVNARREDDRLEFIATAEAARLLDDVEIGNSIGTMPIAQLNDQDRQMDDSITTLDEALKIGEAAKIEFKQECPPDASKLAKEVVALANHQGGILVIGVDDDGSVHGLDNIATTESRLIDVCKEYIDPPIKDISTERKTRCGEGVLVVRVPSANSMEQPYRYDGTAHGRIVHHTRELSDEEIEEWGGTSS
ncbi:AlbA family DNA-binding domain-containing protein [Halosolutus gelatinilyticus]|uniref:AlbA family DNA-binding domain-containing protein n=1 Tax=Halosolutus gelatinilyticus TaxID=2931975 RepID=UPI001FF37203|nr:ATP-binding protein [Halosolutus gelatinilyticus]